MPWGLKKYKNELNKGYSMIRLLRKGHPLSKLKKELYNLEENLSKIRRVCFKCGHFGQTSVSFDENDKITISCDHCGEDIAVLKYPEDFTKKG